jgi:hypothetical protein
MQPGEQKPAPDDGEQDGRQAAFAAHCTQCLRELRKTRLAPPSADWRTRLAWHRTRLGALFTADAELDRRIAAIGSGRRSLDLAEVQVARADALMGEAARHRDLTAYERRVEAATRRRLVANSLADLRGGILS